MLRGRDGFEHRLTCAGAALDESPIREAAALDQPIVG